MPENVVPTENEKKWFLSKTLWFNALSIVGSVAFAFGIDLGLDEEAKAAIIAGVITVGNIVLRLVTKDKLV